MTRTTAKGVAMKPLIEHVETIVGQAFNNKALIIQAFNHSSYVNEYNRARNVQPIESNERLEFLGDAVLELISSEFLYKTYLQESEGFLTKTRSKIVNTNALAFIAKEFQFDHYLKFGRGERYTNAKDRPSILADCFEAVLGAIYLDMGFDRTSKFLYDHVLSRHQELLTLNHVDYKTAFQEELQKNGTVKIEYRLLNSGGPAHDPFFEVGLFVDGKNMAIATGSSKKQAEKKAAKIALEELGCLKQ